MSKQPKDTTLAINFYTFDKTDGFEKRVLFPSRNVGEARMATFHNF